MTRDSFSKRGAGGTISNSLRFGTQMLLSPKMNRNDEVPDAQHHGVPKSLGSDPVTLAHVHIGSPKLKGTTHLNTNT